MKKVCRVCKKEKSLAKFQKRDKTKYRTECTSCTLISHNKWYWRNREKISAYWKSYRKKNKEKFMQYYINHREKALKNKKRYYFQNKKKIRIYKVKYQHSLQGYRLMLFRCILDRLKNCPSYQGRKVFFTKEEFLKWLDNNRRFIKLYNNWKKHKFNINFSPSIDRIDGTKDYSLENVQVLTRLENTKKFFKEDLPRQIIKDFFLKGKYHEYIPKSI